MTDQEDLYKDDVPEDQLAAIDFKPVTVDDFDAIKQIGTVTNQDWGLVFLVRKKDTQELFMMRIVHRTTVSSEEERDPLAQGERNLLPRMAGNPYLLKPFFAFKDEVYYYFVYAFLPGGDLFAHLGDADHEFQEDEVKSIIAELVHAIGFIHAQGFVLRDLKPENLYLDERGHVYIVDYLLTFKLSLTEPRLKVEQGTSEYMAPELLRGDYYGIQVDWWALGILLYEMLSGKPPFYDEDTAVMKQLIQEKPLEIPDHFSPACADIVSKLLNRDPASRLGSGEDGADALKRHPFFEDIDWRGIEARSTEPPFKPKQFKTPLEAVANYDKRFTEVPLKFDKLYKRQKKNQKHDVYTWCEEDFYFYSDKELNNLKEKCIRRWAAVQKQEQVQKAREAEAKKKRLEDLKEAAAKKKQEEEEEEDEEGDAYSSYGEFSKGEDGGVKREEIGEGGTGYSSYSGVDKPSSSSSSSASSSEKVEVTGAGAYEGAEGSDDEGEEDKDKKKAAQALAAKKAEEAKKKAEEEKSKKQAHEMEETVFNVYRPPTVDNELSSGAKESMALADQDKFWFAKRFAETLSMPEGPARRAQLLKYSNDFVEIALHCGRTIIAEVHLPNDKKSLPSINVGGVAGGLKFIVHSMLFKLSHDPQVGKGKFLYGGKIQRPDFAGKSSSYELKACSNFFRYFYENNIFVTLPMQVLIDFLGLRVVAMPVLPLNKETSKIVYGSDDAGRTTHQDDPYFSAVMSNAGQAMHLATHQVGDKMLRFAGDIEGHYCEGKYFLLDMARAFPPESPRSTMHLLHSSQSVFFRLLRPEFLQYLKDNHVLPPLSSDAFSGWGKSSDGSHDMLCDKATEYMCVTLREKMVDDLESKISEHHQEMKWMDMYLEGHQDPGGLNSLNEWFHRWGMPMRHCAWVRDKCLDLGYTQLSRACLSEMVQRSIKNMVKEQMRRLFAPHARVADKEEPHLHERVANLLNLLVDRKEDQVWSADIPADMIQRFGRLSQKGWDKPGDLRSTVRPWLGSILAYSLEASGVRLAASAPPLSLFADPACTATFTAKDIREVVPQDNFMTFINLVKARVLIDECLKPDTTDRQQLITLVSKSREICQSLLRSDPLDPGSRQLLMDNRWLEAAAQSDDRVANTQHKYIVDELLRVRRKLTGSTGKSQLTAQDYAGALTVRTELGTKMNKDHLLCLTLIGFAEQWQRNRSEDDKWRDELEMATALLELGADPNAKLATGETVLQLAQAHGKKQGAVDLLTRAGAKA